jgi:DNA polymerase-3 subunit delta
MEKNILVVSGNDEYTVTQKAREQVTAWVPEEEQALSLEVVEGRASTIDEASAILDQAMAALQTVGLFGGKKVVWLRQATFFKNTVIMKNERVKAQLASWADIVRGGLSQEQFLVISTSGIDRRSAFYKALASMGTLIEAELPERDYELRPVMIKRMRERFAEAEYATEPGAVEKLVDRVGFLTRDLYSEAEKLMIYRHVERRITCADVDVMASATSEAVLWDFTDALIERRVPEALYLYRKLLFQKESPIRLIIALQKLYTDLLQFKEWAELGWVRLAGQRIEWAAGPEIEAHVAHRVNDPRKMHWFRASKLLSQALSQSSKRLDACRRLTLKTHERMISGGTISHALMLEVLLIRLCGKGGAKRAQARRQHV